MKKNFILSMMTAIFCMVSVLSEVHAKMTFVTIGTGGITGVYYPTGGAIAKIVNQKKEIYGIRCTVESTAGSVFNIDSILSGDLEFGIVQSDRQYQAIQGEAEWKEAGPRKELCSVFSIHPEALTLAASVDSGIKTIYDLKGKRVNIGNPGSGQLQNSIDALSAVDINYEKDIKVENVKPAEAPGLLQDGKIDAFFYTVGHPSGAFKETTAGALKVRLIPITGPGIDKLVQQKPYYTKTLVNIRDYPGAENDSDIETFGVKATLCTSVKISDDIVYAVAKEIFENFEEFKKLHPAYEFMTKESMLEGLSAPIHPGAMKYYKEVGLIK